MSTAKRYIFRNRKPYSVEVPTPSGAGRNIPPDGIIEGDYFLNLYQKVNFLELMPEDYKYDPKLLVMSHYRNEIATKLIDEIKDSYASAVAAQRKMEDDIINIPIIPSVIRPDITTSLQQTITEAIKETPRLLPTSEEISAMSTPDLKALAETLGVTYINPKTAFVKAIKSKLAELK